MGWLKVSLRHGTPKLPDLAARELTTNNFKDKMTAFDKSKFTFHGGYLEYEGRFVARFKYDRANAAGFRAFLVVNFSVEEFFGRHQAGEAPLRILESKGYVLGHIRKWLVAAGLPPTPEGKAELIRRQNAIRRMRLAAGRTDEPLARAREPSAASCEAAFTILRALFVSFQTGRRSASFCMLMREPPRNLSGVEQQWAVAAMSNGLSDLNIVALFSQQDSPPVGANRNSLQTLGPR